MADDEILKGAPRLAQHIRGPNKFNKVAAMCCGLLESNRVNRENAAAFFTVLEAGVAAPRMLRRPELRVAYRRLYAAALARETLFSPEARRMLQLWRVRVLAQLDLHTDDTYQFARAAREVRSALERLPCVYPALEAPSIKDGAATHISELERDGWVEAIFDCIEVAMEHHRYAWARASIDALVKAAIDRRHNFGDDEATLLQGWHTQCKGQKILRQQEHARLQKERELSAYEQAEAQWRGAEISAKGSTTASAAGGGLGNWMAKQAPN